MKIDSAYKYATLAPAAQKPARPQESAASATGQSVSLASPELLASGRGADFNVEKVESLKSAIADGTFKINSSAISDRLLNMARELLANGK
jgi:negative regulator of flagellin synthesis FlgM